MTYVKGSFRHHVPSDDDGTPTCLYCLEPWPCDPVRAYGEAFTATVEDVRKEIRPEGPEPVCCDLHAAVWAALSDRADELELWAAEQRDRLKLGE